MPLLHRDGAQITVPDDVVADYRKQGWTAPGEEPSPRPDDSWTVEQLRQLARDRDVVYTGLTKAELLEALT
jgi:hypothetical protein